MKAWGARWPVLGALLCFIAAVVPAYIVCTILLNMTRADSLVLSTALAAAITGVAGAKLLSTENTKAEKADAPAESRALKRFSEALAAIALGESQALDRLLTRSGRLPVSWITQTAPAEAGAAGVARGPTSDWPGQLADLFRNLEQRQLVILGEPGSGKTVMAVSVLLRLMPPPGSPGPVPVRFSMNSWNPRVETLHGWMWRTLMSEYPELEAIVASPDVSRLRGVITRQCILPVLDGLDEIRGGDLRNAAVESIRQGQGADLPMIITSRTAEYAQLSRGFGCLPGATIVRMEPLEPDLALSHLLETAPQEQRALWENVLSVAALDAAAVTPTLTSPLMVWLAGVALDSGQIRAEDLLGRESRPDQAALRQRLLSALVPGAFAVALRRPLRDDRLAGRSDPRQAERWLVFLARRLLDHGRTGIAWWQLQDLAPTRALGLGAVAVAGMAVGIAAGKSALLAVEADIAVFMGVLLGCGFGYAYSEARLSGVALRGRIAYGGHMEGFDADLHIYLRKLLFGLVATLEFALAAAAMTSIWHIFGQRPTFFLAARRYGVLLEYTFISAALALVLGLAGGTIAGVLLRSSNTLDVLLAGARAVNPTSAVRKDKGATIGMFVLGTFVCGILTFAVLWLAAGHAYWSVAATAVTGGVLACQVFAFWPAFRVSTIWFAVRNQLPFGVMGFLEEAHGAGVFRQAGNIYEFRHEMLQESLSGEAGVTTRLRSRARVRSAAD